MPGFSGVEMIDRLKTKQWESVNVFYISGYTANAILQKKIINANIPFQPKPFSVSELACSVREALDQSLINIAT